MRVRIRLLGKFEVSVDGVPVPPRGWARHDAASLVKLLALARDRRLLREQVIEALWPELPVEVAAPRLHKAAHFARRALGGQPGAIVLRNDVVALLPDGDVRVDVPEFERAAAEAAATGTADAAAAVLDAPYGPLLPDDVYESWTTEAREAARILWRDLLRQAQRWDEVLTEEPADEQAHLALARASVDRGDLRAALRQLERMDRAFRQELGTTPSKEAEEMRISLEQRVALPSTTSPSTRLFGRRDVGDRVREHLQRAEGGRGGTLLVTGPPGVGKSAVLGLAEALAHRRGWRTGRGTASAMEGPWPYSPVLEALGDLCRQHPALLDGLDDIYRLEIERALSGQGRGLDAARPATSGCSSPPPSCCASRPQVTACCSWWTTSRRRTRRRCGCCTTCPAVPWTSGCCSLLAHRHPGPTQMREVRQQPGRPRCRRRASSSRRSDARATQRLLADRFPELDEATRRAHLGGRAPACRSRCWSWPGRRAADDRRGVRPALPPAVAADLPAGRPARLDVQHRRAAGGLGRGRGRDLPTISRWHSQRLVVERGDAGYRFRHALVRESLVQPAAAGQPAPPASGSAEQLAALGAAPAGWRTTTWRRASRRAPCRSSLRAVETAGALGAYRDALTLVDAVPRRTPAPTTVPRLLARRGDLLMALGDPAAVAAYRDAVRVTTGTEHRLVRARLARAAERRRATWTTAAAALAGLELEGDAADAPILLARGNLAYFSGDIDAAWDAAGQARDRLQPRDDPWQIVDLVGLQGLIAHQRGEWFERFRLELRRTAGQAGAGHRAVRRAPLRRRVPALRPGPLRRGDRASRGPAAPGRRRPGALRGVAFATALIGEAALLMGDLERAERELLEAARPAPRHRRPCG